MILYNGHYALRANSVYLDFGKEQGNYALHNDPDLVELYDDKYCLMSDDTYKVDTFADYETLHVDQLGDYDDIHWDHNNCQYAFEDAGLIYGYIGRREAKGWFSESDDIIKVDDTYYISGTVAHYYNIYYSDYQCCWMDCDDEDFYEAEEESTNYNAGYHFLKRVDISGTCTYKIGVEIEKEDEGARNSVYANKLHNRTKWCKEDDGSLNDDSGYELVSPTYELMSNKLIEDIRSDDDLLMLVNGDYSKKHCGGHIHLSLAGVSGHDLFDNVAGYLPMLYAIYPDRTTNALYCAVKKTAEMKNDRSKFQAIRILEDRVEFRIFPAVHNTDDLEWRIKLMRIIATTPANDPATVIFNMLDRNQKLSQFLIEKFGEDRTLSLASDTLAWVNKLEDKPLNLSIGWKEETDASFNRNQLQLF